MKKVKRKEAKKRPPKAEKKNAPNPQHKRDFEQLLDDSIFGVRKK